VTDHSKIPVLKHYKGVCHIFIDESADPEMATRISVNAKVQKPAVCNAVETLLVHENVARSSQKLLSASKGGRGLRDVPNVPILPNGEARRTLVENIWTSFSLSKGKLRIEAMKHISFTDLSPKAILTSNSENAERFLKVDSSCVLHECLNAVQ
jgi:glutamate-5-semialdehyde dehydrogenase